jgi:hypothetical protein
MKSVQDRLEVHQRETENLTKASNRGGPCEGRREVD